MTKLLPCPFCDGEAVLTKEYWTFGGTLKGGDVICTGCRVKMPRKHFVHDLSPADRWNQRP